MHEHCSRRVAEFPQNPQSEAYHKWRRPAHTHTFCACARYSALRACAYFQRQHPLSTNPGNATDMYVFSLATRRLWPISNFSHIMLVPVHCVNRSLAVDTCSGDNVEDVHIVDSVAKALASKMRNS